jgi:hypothetical protein
MSKKMLKTMLPAMRIQIEEQVLFEMSLELETGIMCLNDSKKIAK